MVRPTIKDVAKRAGVSYQTVSRVINNSQSVHPKTRTLVEKAIKELGYRPSSIARSMVHGKTFTIGCISPNLTDFVFAKIIDSAQVEARRLGFILLSASTENDRQLNYLLEEMLERRVDGLIIINPREINSIRYLNPVLKNNIPIVVVKDKAGDLPVSSVTCDGFSGAITATEYLLSLGHTAIATITGPMNDSDARGRLEGYQKSQQEAGIKNQNSLIAHGDWTERSGQRAAKSLLDSGRPFTAIFVQNDRMALGAIHACINAGRRVPEDISIIGFDDAPFAAYLIPSLTTMHQPIGKLGQHAARVIGAAIQTSAFNPQQIELMPKLIERKSCLSLS